MIKIFLWSVLGLFSCTAAPAVAQTVSGCGTATIPNADAKSATKLSTQIACFTKVGAAASKAVSDRQAQVKAIVAVLAAGLSPTATPTPKPTIEPIAATSVPNAAGLRFEIGINVASSIYYNTERAFANLAEGAGAWKDAAANYAPLTPEKLNTFGYPAISTAGFSLNPPQPTWSGQSVAVTCTWLGDGTISLDGDVRSAPASKKISFKWPGLDRVKKPTGRPSVSLLLKGVTASNPFRNLDCREPNLKTVGRFDARYIEDLKPYRVLRFLDWSNTNGNPTSVTWASRSTLTKNGNDGIALEKMIELANAADADPWFPIAWNADENYVRRAGELVRDRLRPGRRAYFELSNEVWNFGFPVARQAMTEGQQSTPPLSSDPYGNNPLRLAEKSIWFHKILTEVFKANPARLVRVIATQNGNASASRAIFGFKDLAKWVDALATAPYFGHSFFKAPFDEPTLADLPALFDRLEVLRAEQITKALRLKVTADKYGKRFITYEAGQHIIPGNPATQNEVYAAMQRDPRMGQIYARFIADWKAKMNDTLVLYSATGSIGRYGAWGNREYAGQPVSETPKRRAVLDAIAQP